MAQLDGFTKAIVDPVWDAPWNILDECRMTLEDAFFRKENDRLRERLHENRGRREARDPSHEGAAHPQLVFSTGPCR